MKLNITLPHNQFSFRILLPLRVFLLAFFFKLFFQNSVQMAGFFYLFILKLVFVLEP